MRGDVSVATDRRFRGDGQVGHFLFRLDDWILTSDPLVPKRDQGVNISIGFYRTFSLSNSCTYYHKHTIL